jgi:hypothetical protein
MLFHTSLLPRVHSMYNLQQCKRDGGEWGLSVSQFISRANSSAIKPHVENVVIIERAQGVNSQIPRPQAAKSTSTVAMGCAGLRPTSSTRSLESTGRRLVGSRREEEKRRKRREEREIFILGRWQKMEVSRQPEDTGCTYIFHSLLLAFPMIF